jgi:uncharacterized protein (DUF58 family)
VTRPRGLAAGGVLLCAAGALLALPALYVPGIAMLLAAVAAPAWVRAAAARASVSLAPSAVSVYEGERVSVTVDVSLGRVPSPEVAIYFAGARVPLAHARGRTRVPTSVFAGARGLQMLGPAVLRLEDPLGICSRELLSETHDLLVLPRVYTVGPRALSRLHQPAAGRAPAGSQLQLDSLRRHEPSAPATRIHWPTVARTGVLMSRPLAREAEPRVLVALDARRPESADALDRAVRAAASLCVHLARRGGCELLLPGERRPRAIGADLRGWPAAHARLALVHAGGTLALDALASSARATVYVTACAGAGADLPAIRWRVAPHPLAGIEVAFTVAGCSAQPLGERARSEAA